MFFYLLNFISIISISQINHWETLDINHNCGEKTVFDNLDTIKFYRNLNQVSYSFINLNSQDSTFEIFSLDTLSVPTEEGKMEQISVAGTTPWNQGIFILDTIKGEISFKFNLSTNWYKFTFKVSESKGNSQPKLSPLVIDYLFPFILYRIKD